MKAKHEKKTSRIGSKYRDTLVEMGKNHNGLHNGVAKDSKMFNAIWVIVDQLTKLAHFLLVKTTYMFT